MSYNYLNLNIISVFFPLRGYLHILTINLRFGPFWIKRKEEEGEKKSEEDENNFFFLSLFTHEGVFFFCYLLSDINGV